MNATQSTGCQLAHAHHGHCGGQSNGLYCQNHQDCNYFNGTCYTHPED